MFLRVLSSVLFAACMAACGGGDGEGAEAPPSSPQAAAPPAGAPAGPARLVTLIGSREAAGLHWIFVGDGFTSAQMPELEAAARSLAREMLEAPELATHAAVWNVHLLEAGSRESGVDDAARGRFVDTAFDGELGCGSNSRVACVDWEAIEATLRGLDAPAGERTVILNTRDYVGSANTSGIIVSRNEHAPRIVVHEMGHRVAGLADEYVDSLVASEWRPYYVEGRFANVTTRSTADEAPWRHWLADTGTGVGLYEGAFYVATGFFRPKQDSLMRTLEAPLGQVNAEAWLRAQYRVLPPVTAVSPAVARVQGLAGETLEFSVSTPWPREAVRLSWHVDGVEVVDARDSLRFQYLSDGRTHEVEVRARDVSGRIRAPDAVEARIAHAWQLSPDAPSTGAKTARTTAPSSWLRLRVDSAGHAVVSQHEAAPLAGPFSPPGEPDWNYALLAEDGSVIASGGIHDPRVVRSSLSAPGEPQAGHARVLLETGHYVIAVPQGLLPRKLRIAANAAVMEKAGGPVPGAGAIEIDLDPR